MSHGGLGALLRAHVAANRRARAVRRPLAEVIEDVPISRRTVLRLGAASAAGWASGCGRPSPTVSPAAPTVAIVGAGLAGLTCAFHLTRAGITTRVFEAQVRAGGRVRSVSGPVDAPLVCELGGERIAAEHVTIRGLCDALGLVLDDVCDDPTPTRGILWFGGQRYSSLQVADAFTPIAEAIAREHARVGTFAVRHGVPGPAADLDAQSLAAWLDTFGVSGWSRDLIEVATTTEFGLDADEQSALTFVAMFAGVEPRCFDPSFEDVQRFRVRGGNDQVAARMADHLASGIELESVLEAIRRDGHGYRLTFRRAGRSQDVTADAIVLAVPFTTLRDVTIDVPLPPAKARAIAELGHGTHTKLLAGVRGRPWRAIGSDGTVLSDVGFQSVWDGARTQPGEAGVLASLTGGRRGLAMGDGDPREQADALTAALDPIFPGAAVGQVGEIRAHWPSEPWSRGSYGCYRPGQRAAFGGAEAEPVDRMFFAGEHTATTHIGFMEGACESGQRAALEVLTALGRPPVERLAAPPTSIACARCR